MPGTTTNFALPYPEMGDVVDAGDIEDFADAVDTELATLVTNGTATTRRPAALVVRDSGTQSFASGAALANLTYTTERFDNNTMGNLGTNNERLTVVTSGVYCVYARMLLSGSNDDIGAATLFITINGTILAGSKQRLAVELNCQLARRLTATDIIRAQFTWTGASSPKNITRAELGARWLCSL